MAVYRVNKNRGYTVMANYHLRDKTLSLKAVGLLSKMLSFNDGWQFSTKGLSAICKEGPDAVLAALRELEDAGYLVRHQSRDEKGRMSSMVFEIYEKPQTGLPDTEKPHTEKPDTDNPFTGKPCTENPAQLNTMWRMLRQKASGKQWIAESIPLRRRFLSSQSSKNTPRLRRIKVLKSLSKQRNRNQKKWRCDYVFYRGRD